MSTKHLFSLALALSLTGDAWAKKTAETTTEAAAPTEITECGIKPFDDVFMKAKDIHTTLDTAQAKLSSANTSVGAALGLPAGTPFKDALADLKTKAEGKVSVVMDGAKPTLSAQDGVPANVKAAVDATNAAVSDITSVVELLAALPEQAKALSAEAQAFPSKLNTDLIKESGLKVTDLPKVTKTVNSDVKAVAQTPDRAKMVVDEATGMLSTVSSTFVP